MKQLEDNLTGDLLNGAVRQRGRPVTGKAMTGAQRQAARRVRLAEQGKTSLTVEISVEAAQFLSAFVQFKDQDKDAVIERLIRSQLMRKR